MLTAVPGHSVFFFKRGPSEQTRRIIRVRRSAKHRCRGRVTAFSVASGSLLLRVHRRRGPTTYRSYRSGNSCDPWRIRRSWGGRSAYIRDKATRLAGIQGVTAHLPPSQSRVMEERALPLRDDKLRSTNGCMRHTRTKDEHPRAFQSPLEACCTQDISRRRWSASRSRLA